MGNGSERSEYVPQEYMFSAVGFPSRLINIMYEYHPSDKLWPEMGILVNKKYIRSRKTNGYFPYMGIECGHTKCEPFNQMRDIRRFGQDVQLTMTFDLDISKKDMITIAKQLSTFGNLIFRINHEANGHWWTFHKETNNNYKKIGDFFIAFHKILKEYAPNVKTNLCFNGVAKEHSNQVWNRLEENELAPAARIADIISFDYYHSLHWGWPYDGWDPVRVGQEIPIVKMEKDYTVTNEIWWEIFYDFKNSITKTLGRTPDIYLGEANTDADCVGITKQAEWIKKFYKEVSEKKDESLKGVVFYQFRDRGGLGLEYEYDEYRDKGRPNPALSAYKEAASNPYFQPSFAVEKNEIKGPAILEWVEAQNSKGIYLEEKLPEKNTKKTVLKFKDKSNLIIKANDMWYHKGTEKNELDITNAILKNSKILKLYVFAPPAVGENKGVYKLKVTAAPRLIFK